MIKILFVDDEPELLDGLRRMLRGNRDRWDMRFLSDPVAAVELIATEAFDVVVTDMRMPVIDGTEVLKRVRSLQPNAIRIVLSGQTEMTSAIRSLPIAHQFLAKPCDPDRLAAAIGRSRALSVRLSALSMRRAVGAVTSLPSPSSTVIALQEALADPQIDAARIASLVGSDVGISLKLLQVVNSAFFGLPRMVTDPNEAISYLGVQTISDIVIATELLGAANSRSNASDVNIASLQLRAKQRSDLAQALALSAGQVKAVARLAWVGGFLADVGNLVLADLDDATIQDFAVLCDDPSDLGPVIGAYLLSIWGLPHELVETVALQHDPPDETSPVVAGYVWAAQQLIDGRPIEEIIDGGAHILGLDSLHLSNLVVSDVAA